MADSDSDLGKKSRSPNFPYINLTVALERAAQLFASSRGNPVRLADAAGDWGLSATSSGTQRVAAALISFGLLSDEGSGDDRRLRLTQNAQRILGDTRPGVREELIREAALRPATIREYFNKWRHRRPSDTHAVSQLKFDSGFNDEAARMFLRVFDDALSYLIEVDESAPTEANREPLTTQSDTGSALTVNEPAPAVQTVRATGQEWLKVKVGRDTSVQIVCDGAFGKQELQRLIRLLQVQMEMMDDDF